MAVLGENPFVRFPAGNGDTFGFLPVSCINREALNYHSLTPRQSQIRRFMYHRFGVIPAAVSTATVQPGRELLCHYNWEYHDGAPWFQVGPQ